MVVDKLISLLDSGRNIYADNTLWSFIAIWFMCKLHDCITVLHMVIKQLLHMLLLFYKFARCLISGMDLNFNFNSTAERDKLALAIFGSCYNDMERYIYRIYIKQ